MRGTAHRPYRRTAIAAAAVASAVALASVVATGSPASAGAPATTQTAGTAAATATSYKVNPTTASLSIGITFGISLAGYTNQVAQAESRGIDLGIIGTTLAGEGCDGGDPTLPADQQPQPLRADSRDPDASQEKSENEKFLPLISKSVRADATPFSQATTTTSGLTASGAFLDLSSARSKAVTHLVNGTREAVATVDIAGVGIAGVVELSNLHWEAKAQSGSVDKTDGIFTIGKMKVLGQELPTNSALTAFENANKLLANLGIQLTYPQSHLSAGILFVDPLAIRVVPNPQRDAISQLVLGTIQPVRENLYDALLAQDCGNATYITVSDIALGSVTGAGSFSLELGGVNAKSEALKTTNFLNFSPSLSNAGSLNDSFGDSLGVLDNSSSLGNGLATNSNAGAKTGTKGPQRAAQIADAKGSRGGRMALVGLLGLLVLAIVAESDRRMMRRAQRSIATEA